MNPEIKEETTVSKSTPEQTVTETKTVTTPMRDDDYSAADYTQRSELVLRLNQVILFVAVAVELLLAVRFLLRLIGASPAVGFANLMYSLSDPFARPFSGIIASVVNGVSIVEWYTVMAMVVYAIGAWALTSLILMIAPAGKQQAWHTHAYGHR